MSQHEVSREVQEIWDLFREVAYRHEEVAKRQEEAGIQIREVAKRQEETDREIRGLNEGIKDLRVARNEAITGQWGKLVEALVEPSVLRLFQARGIQVIDTAQWLKTTRNGEQEESTNCELRITN